MMDIEHRREVNSSEKEAGHLRIFVDKAGTLREGEDGAEVGPMKEQTGLEDRLDEEERIIAEVVAMAVVEVAVMEGPRIEIIVVDTVEPTTLK